MSGLKMLRGLPKAYDALHVCSVLPSIAPPLPPHNAPGVDIHDSVGLAWDYYCWLEDEFGLPIVREYSVRNVFEVSRPPSLIPDSLYSDDDLETLYGQWVRVGYTRATYTRRRERPGVHPEVKRFSGSELAGLVRRVEQVWFDDCLKELLCRFYTPCGRCRTCIQGYRTCEKVHDSFGGIRFSLERFLQSVRPHKSLSAWWQRNGQLWCESEYKEREAAPGVILLWLHDRGYLDLSYDDLALSPSIKSTARGRKSPHRGGKHWMGVPNEWLNRFVDRRFGIEGLIQHVDRVTDFGDHTNYAAMTFRLLVIRNRIHSWSDWLRPLTGEDLERAQYNFQILKPYIANGYFSPIALSEDVRVGHMALDSIRFWIWYRAKDMDRRTTFFAGYATHFVSRLEAALGKDWHLLGMPEALPPRTEASYKYSNPWLVVAGAEAEGTCISLFPNDVQAAVQAWVLYELLSGHLVSTVISRYGEVVLWLGWCHSRKLFAKPWTEWTGADLRQAVENWLVEAVPPDQLGAGKIRSLRSFLKALASLDNAPRPKDLSVLNALRTPKRPAGWKINTPAVPLVERIFEDGVCELDRTLHQKRARLGLTLAYCLGVRPGEALKFHLECMTTDSEGFPVWWVPRLKRHSDRYVPIIPAFHMGRLLEFYREWYAQLVQTTHTCPTCVKEWDATGMPYPESWTCPECKVQVEPRIHKRYLRDPLPNAQYRGVRGKEHLARSWRYLLASPPVTKALRRGVLSSTRLEIYLDAALYLAAFKNPDGILKMETYSPLCRRKIAAASRLRCTFIAPVDGIKQCPVCEGELGGYKGELCERSLTSAFECTGEAKHGEAFCPRCHYPLAEMVVLNPNMFRHNSVDRFAQTIGDDDLSSSWHGHTVTVQKDHYRHVRPREIVEKIHQVVTAGTMASALVEPTVPNGQSHSEDFNTFLGKVVRQFKQVKFGPLWGTFVADGTTLVLPETVGSAVEQFYWTTRMVYGQELAIVQLLGQEEPAIPEFLRRADIEPIIKGQIALMKNFARTKEGLRVLENNIALGRKTLDELEQLLKPWVARYGSIEALVTKWMTNGREQNAAD